MRCIILNLTVLGSGSSGNSIYIETKEISLLIDAGFSFRETSKRLDLINKDIKTLSALLITHEHIDHCRGARVISKKCNIPVYLNRETYHALPETVSQIQGVQFFITGNIFTLGDLTIETFSTPHDAASPVGLTVKNRLGKIAIATDLGYVTKLVHERIKDAHSLVIESNHDPEMLKVGPYPWSVKQRVKSKSGHLSNEECSQLLKALAENRLKNVVLAHLSEKNNHPDIARITAQEVLENTKIALQIASQKNPGELITH